MNYTLLTKVEKRQKLQNALHKSSLEGMLVGASKAIRGIRKTIEQIAPSNASVLVLGETGTGKELVAMSIHRLSPRSSGPFIAINCAAMPEGLLESELFGIEERTATGVQGRIGRFEQADGGTRVNAIFS